MFKRLKECNWFILVYDSLMESFEFLSKCFLGFAFIFLIGFFYDLSLNPIFLLPFPIENIGLFVHAIVCSLIVYVIHLLMSRFRFVYIQFITSKFPVTMKLGERKK